MRAARRGPGRGPRADPARTLPARPGTAPAHRARGRARPAPGRVRLRDVPAQHPPAGRRTGPPRRLPAGPDHRLLRRQGPDRPGLRRRRPLAGRGARRRPEAPARSTAPDPLYRPGPQPDLWIPESTADYEEARRGMPSTGSPATLSDTGPVAYSPLVVGIPAGTQLDGVERVDAPWKDLLTSTDSDHRNLRLLRPSPVLSGTGLLHTLGLYLAGDGAPSGRPAPRPHPRPGRRAPPGRPGSQYAGSPELLCSLRQDGGPDQAPDRPGTGRSPHSAPLVSEKSLADFNLGHALGGCPALDAPPPLGDRYYAYYPKNVPALDHPLIRVDWAGTADAAPRRAAVARFADWLRDPAGGQRSLTAQGYRGLPRRTAPRPVPTPRPRSSTPAPTPTPPPPSPASPPAPTRSPRC
ncbi:substrate-binding domain-containing protein [Streptomyces noursei]|nr:substrate-binding domain-containing protein [Streptomyces noursei]